MRKMEKTKKETICLRSGDVLNMRLHSIEQEDIERIRTWKNRNRDRFFYKEVISSDEQRSWYQQYLSRAEDYIFVVEAKSMAKWDKIGCIGYRKVNDVIDLYNIIRGEKTQERSSMKDAMKMLLAYLMQTYDLRIKCDVLVDNPAVEWYNKCGFLIKDHMDGYYVMEFEQGGMRLPCIEREEI